ncbi:MAG TPA: hypothetical protein GYA07_00275 [Verrucomicrobia bacterium]|nr:hypothetical protein [Verrucomicrobiota bacterium]HOP98976.1 hypothetical protein [Verrucomicrobiota bacterium]
MDADERDIYNYLKSVPNQFISAKEISRRASGKRRYREEPGWAIPVLARMVEKSLIESDSTNHYRVVTNGKSGRPKKWISPHIRRILEKSGKDFQHVIRLSDDDDDILFDERMKKLEEEEKKEREKGKGK